MEKYRSGLGYKKISQTLNIPRSTIKSIIKKWKEYDTTTNLTKEGHPPKLTDQAWRALIRGNKENNDDPEGGAKLHSGDGVSAHRTTELGFTEEWPEKSHCKHVWGSPKAMC